MKILLIACSLFYLYSYIFRQIDWYTAKIIVASADRFMYDVEFDDGESASDLHRRKVRRHRAFEVGEDVQVDVTGDFGYKSASIVGLHQGSMMVDLVVKSSTERKSTMWSQIRRRQ
jgi:hypothetical protein